jgi:hypothetical protein
MIPKKTLIIICIAISFGYLCDATASDKRNYISISAAVFDVLQQDNSSFEGRAEFHGSEFSWLFKPLSGIMGNTDGAIHVYGGVLVDIPLFSFLYISPSFAPGIYYKSNSKDLDFLLEFRSQIEIALMLDNDIKVGLSFNHISNASLGSTNPGVESIALTYHFPF